MKKCSCPVCKGTGRISVPGISIKKKREAKKKIILRLQKKGYSVREIMKYMGYRSTSIINHYLS